MILFNTKVKGGKQWQNLVVAVRQPAKVSQRKHRQFCVMGERVQKAKALLGLR
jgi:hypothetical protein